MIRITKSPARITEDYLVLALILQNGLDSICDNSCDDCPARRVCKSVKSARTYAVKCAGFDFYEPSHNT